MLSTSYATLDNEREAESLNPDRLLNASATFIHTRLLSDRWIMTGTVSGGLYTDLDNVGWEALMATGTLTFIYRLDKQTSIGVGGVLTNLYGVPILLPMFHFQWTTTGD